MRFLLTTIISIFLCLSAIGAAKADYNVWRDAKTGMSLSYPDSWRQVNDADRGGVITLMGPAGRGHAMCRVRADEDKRYTIYPQRFDKAIQKFDFSAVFLDQYIKEYSEEDIVVIFDEAGIGDSFAGYILADYESAVPGPYMSRRGFVYAALHYDTLYIFECSSHRDAFPDWKGPFMSIAKSLDFPNRQTSVMTGHYRDFRGEGNLPHKDYKGTKAVVLDNGY